METFSYINKSVNDNNSLLYYVSRAGSGEVKSDFNIKRNNLYPYCVVHYVAKGSGHVIYRDKDNNISQGDLFILNAYEKHNYFTDKDNLLQLQWVEFAGGDCVKLITSILKNDEFIIKTPDSKKINESLYEIFNIIKENNDGNQFSIFKIIYSMLLNLLYMNRNNSNNRFFNSSLNNISKAIYFIDNNLGEHIDIEMLLGI